MILTISHLDVKLLVCLKEVIKLLRYQDPKRLVEKVWEQNLNVNTFFYVEYYSFFVNHDRALLTILKLLDITMYTIFSWIE